MSDERENQAQEALANAGEGEGKFGPWRELKIALIAAVGRLAVWLLGWSARFRVEGWETVVEMKQAGTPVILSFWHNQILLATYFWRFRDIVVITSRHFDGEYIARIIRSFGYGAARGSSTRGAVKALLELRNCLRSGRDVAFTVDGPRGPVYRVKPGPVLLAKKTGSPIVCFHVEARRSWSLNSWDKFRIPRPFTAVLLKIGTPLWVKEADDLPAVQEQYQAEMERLRAYCEKYDWSAAPY